MASDLSHPPSRLDPRSTACTQRTTDLGIYMHRRIQITKKKLTKPIPNQNTRYPCADPIVEKNYLLPAQIHLNQKLPRSAQSMSDYVPDSPTSVSSSGPRSPQYSPHDEDFTVPYWGCYWVAHDERTARYLIELREHTEAFAEREAVWRLAWLGLLDEEIAAR